MDVIRDARILPGAQVRFRGRYRALIGEASDSIGGLVLRAGETVPRRRADDVAGQAGDIVQRVFVDGRRSLTPDGVPLTPYARELMTEIYLVTAGIVNRHADYMERHLDDETRALLLRPARRLQEQEEQVERLFRPNPLAEYEPPHTWVDPNGYTLSTRIWNNSVEVRRKLDGLLSDLIRQGVGSREIARQVEQFLLPGRAKIRTNKPYGSDASYDAMRLARTEISRAHNQASYISAYLNPYVDQIRLRRSPNGDPTCPVCLRHAGPVGGEGRVYSIQSPVLAPLHPQCQCRVDAEVTRSPVEVTREIRERMRRAQGELALVTPVQRQTFMELLLGEALTRFMRQLVLGQLPLEGM